MPARPKMKLVKGGAAGPSKPDWLSPMASDEWDRCVPLLCNKGLISEHDQIAFSAYCELTAEFIGSPSEFPSAKMTQLRLLMSDFGMTPSSRVKLPDPAADKGNKFEGF